MNTRNHFKSGFLRAALMLTLAVMIFPLEAWADSTGTFSNLREEIGSGGDKKLSNDSYEYDVGDGDVIEINTSGTINGCGATIDMGGSNISVFNIKGDNVIIKNLTIQNASNTAIVVDGDNCIIENCTFIGNNATNSSGAIYVNGKACTIQNCAFINNGKTTISYSSSAPTVKDNWFGNTAEYYETAPATGVQMESWLFLGAIANPQKILKGESSEVVFKLYSYDGNSVSEYDKMDVRLDLSQTLGTLDKDAASLGEVITYTASELGQAGVTATFGTVSYTVDILNAVSTEYIDVDGNMQTAMACPLNGTETSLGDISKETWYVCNSDVSYDGMLHIYGDSHLILCDGKKMTVASTDYAGIMASDGSLSIYGQSTGDGVGLLSVSSYESGISISMSSLTINGGQVEATGGNGCYGINNNFGITINGGQVKATGGCGGIFSLDQYVTINGGQVTAKATDNEAYFGISGSEVNINGGQVTATSASQKGISAFGSYIILGWTKSSDFIQASNYSIKYGYRVKIPAGMYLAYTDGDETTILGSADAYYIFGEGTNATLDDIAGKTLIPAVPFEIDDPYVVKTFDGNWKVGSGAKTFMPAGYDLSTGQVTLEEVIGAPDGQPVIIGLENGQNLPATCFLVAAQGDEVKDDYDSAVGNMSQRFAITDGTKTLAEVISATGVTASEAVILVLANGKFTSVDFSADDLGKKTKAGLLLFVLTKWEYMQVKPSTQPASAPLSTRAIGIDFGGETTGIEAVLQTTPDPSLLRRGMAGAPYYDLQGRRIAQPTRKGIYIRNGKKIIIK